MTGWLTAWIAATVLSVAFSADRVAAMARSSWTWNPWHKNDLALVPLLLAFLPWWAWIPGVAAIALSNSRNAMLGLGVVAWLRLPRGWRPWALGGGLLALAALALVDPYLATRGTARLGHWLVALQMFTAHPLLGAGPFTFTDFYLNHLPTSLPFGIVPEVALIPWAHNLYLEVLAERGLIGFAVFAGATIWALRHRGPTRHALVALLAMAVFDLTFLKAWVSLAFWGLIWGASRVPA